ncbi:MAG: TlyA family RNA methyltransferase [Clostridia bacterium]|nr:TlyA family RNA methyltransferase [Clostridia bacterium]
MRIDVFLHENGYADSRQRAKVLITSECVSVNGKIINKPAYDVDISDMVVVSGDPIGYVSRGALKLKAAFEEFNLDAKNLVCIDVGASTGGFTDFLLKNGAATVYAVDSGTNQLSPSLLNDARVVSMEKYNARNLSPTDFGCAVDMAVMDVSFISQTLIIPALVNVLRDGAVFVSLIKPQFEAGKDAVGKGGIVKNPASRAFAIKKVIECATVNGLSLRGLTVSPILGGDGNTEYLAYFTKDENNNTFSENLDLLISRCL